MTIAQWYAEVSRRIRQYEGCRLYKYFDTQGVVTIGYGHALEGDMNGITLTRAGINLLALEGAPIAATSSPENAVAPCITQEQADALFDLDLPAYVSAARHSLPDGVFDLLDDARRFVIVDLVFNMGPGAGGWGGFTATQALIVRGQAQKNQGNGDAAHALFSEAADHLAASAWARQVGQRAIDDVAMMRSSTWVPPLAEAA